MISFLLNTNEHAFTINYNSLFTNVPKCAISIASINYRPSGDNGEFHVPREINHQITYSTVKIWFAYAPSLSYLSVNCLIIDQVLDPSILYYNL